MSKEKKEKLLRASELIKAQDSVKTDLSNLVALSMQTGYELGRNEAGLEALAAEPQS